MNLEYISLGVGIVSGVAICLAAEVFILGLIQVRQIVFGNKR